MSVVYPDQVVDEHSHTYLLEPEPLGVGGQGAVFRCASNPELVVKLTNTAGEEIERRLKFVRTLRLPDDLCLARPLVLVTSAQGHVGYIMRLLRDMAPISRLVGGFDEEPVRFYTRTGGLRRRLQILAGLARSLARLHGVPLVYADISWNNIFVSTDETSSAVWMIDADNLTYSTGDGPRIYTPGFGAPEILRLFEQGGSGGATTLSDCYAFACMAFEVLSLCPPFEGGGAEESVWDSSSAWGASKQASSQPSAHNAGQKSWVFAPEDESHRPRCGFPREFFLNDELFGLFKQTFSAGYLRPEKRPGMARWAHALERAAARTITCQECGLTHYLAKTCPACDEPWSTPFMAVYAHRWEPDLGEVPEQVTETTLVVRQLVELKKGEVAHLSRDVAWPSTLARGAAPCLGLELMDRGVRLSVLSDGPYTLIEHGHRPVTVQGSRVVSIPTHDQPLLIHCGPLDRPHRVLSMISFRPEER